MSLNATFFITSALFGLGLAVDGFLISLSNGLNNSKMCKWQILLSAFVFASFQFGAVLLGWFCVAELVKYFSFIENLLSYIALIMLCFIGTKMIVNGAKKCRKNAKTHNTTQINNKNKAKKTNIKLPKNNKPLLKNKIEKVKKLFYNETVVTLNIKVLNKTNKKIISVKKWVITLLIQGIITSVDALSVGFVISGYAIYFAIICALIISCITLNMYLIGFKIGKTFGNKLGSKAELVGGIVFILIGIEIFICSFL